MEESKSWCSTMGCGVPLRTRALYLAYFNLGVQVFILCVDTLLNVIEARTVLQGLNEFFFPFLSLVSAVILIFALRKNNASLLHVYMWYGTMYIAVMVLVCFMFWKGKGVSLKMFRQVFDIVSQAFMLLLVHSVRVDILKKAIATYEYLLCVQQQALADAHATNGERRPVPTAPPETPFDEIELTTL